MEDTETKAPEAEATAEAKKEFIPAKYRDKYKGTHAERGDTIGEWFRAQIGGKDPAKALELIALNSPKANFVEKRQTWLESKVHGAGGRILMDVRNSLIGCARRQDGKLKGLDGSEFAPVLPEKQKAPARKAKASEAQAAA